jgi:hypothetical protein
MQRLENLRHALLRLHQSFVDAERLEYERVHGRVPGGQLLDALINEPEFAWLKALTTLIVQLDEQVDEANPQADAADEESRMLQLRALLRPDAAGSAFQQRYATLLQRSPDVVVAHAAVAQALR